MASNRLSPKRLAKTRNREPQGVSDEGLIFETSEACSVTCVKGVQGVNQMKQCLCLFLSLLVDTSLEMLLAANLFAFRLTM